MRVKVIKVDSKYLVLRWTDPDTGQIKQKSAGTNKRKEAERLAAQLEADLNAGRYFDNKKVTWEEFRERFENERFGSLGKRTGECYGSTFNRVEELLRPMKLSQLDSSRVSRFQVKLRELDLSETTIAKHLRHLKAALRWASSMGMLQRVPDFHFPRKSKQQRVMKGRPLEDSEFEKMINSVEGVVGNQASPSWKFFLEGLWWSGLRLQEALQLNWEPCESIYIDRTSKRPMFRIAGEYEKAGRDRLLPMAPEFSQFLDKVESDHQNGKVFKLVGLRGQSIEENVNWVSNVGCRIGKAAGIEVNRFQKRTGTKIKYASIHDLRRSFGARWSMRVLPQILKELMRHASIETTLRYYVGHDAERIADEIWQFTKGLENDKT